MAFKIKNVIMNTLTPIIKLVVTEVLKMLFRSFYKKQPEHAEVFFVSMYPVVDVELESLFEKTESDLDDAIIDGVKDAFETVAGENDIALPNLDED